MEGTGSMYKGIVKVNTVLSGNLKGRN